MLIVNLQEFGEEWTEWQNTRSNKQSEKFETIVCALMCLLNMKWWLFDEYRLLNDNKLNDVIPAGIGDLVMLKKLYVESK